MGKRCALFIAWVIGCLIAAVAIIGVAIEVEHFDMASVA